MGRGRAWTRGGLRRGRLSREFRTEELCADGGGDVTAHGDDDTFVETDGAGRVVLLDARGATLPPAAVRALPLAGDVQRRGVLLGAGGGDTWRVRAARDAAPGDQLELWFDEELLARLEMPFLTPQHIRGRRCYACLACGAQFERPNPLKIHLFLSCAPYSARAFWRRFLLKVSSAPGAAPAGHDAPLNLSLATFALERPRSHGALAALPAAAAAAARCCSEPPFSAFRPYRLTAASLAPPPLPPPPLAWSEVERRVAAATAALRRVAVTGAAEAEAFATDWGKSKEGHLCLYCGKVYSRKYGLKIHIRTHTGYKPLQCKFCLRPFGDPSNLNKHVRLHARADADDTDTDAAAAHRCRLCGKTLVRRRDLERHLRSRHASALVASPRAPTSPTPKRPPHTAADCAARL